MDNTHYVYESKGNKKIVLSFEDDFPVDSNEVSGGESEEVSIKQLSSEAAVSEHRNKTN